MNPSLLNYEILSITDDYIISFNECLEVSVYEIETIKKVGDFYLLPASGFQVAHKNYLISYREPSFCGTSELSIYDAKTCEKIFLKNCQRIENYSFYYPYLAIGFVGFRSKFYIEVICVGQKSSGPMYVHEFTYGNHYGRRHCDFSVHGNVLCVQMYDGIILFC